MVGLTPDRPVTGPWLNFFNIIRASDANVSSWFALTEMGGSSKLYRLSLLSHSLSLSPTLSPPTDRTFLVFLL